MNNFLEKTLWTSIRYETKGQDVWKTWFDVKNITWKRDLKLPNSFWNKHKKSIIFTTRFEFSTYFTRKGHFPRFQARNGKNEMKGQNLSDLNFSVSRFEKSREKCPFGVRYVETSNLVIKKVGFLFLVSKSGG